MMIPSDLASCLRGHVQFPDSIWRKGGGGRGGRRGGGGGGVEGIKVEGCDVSFIRREFIDLERLFPHGNSQPEGTGACVCVLVTTIRAS